MLRRQSKNTMNGLDLMDDKKKHEDLEDGNYIRRWFVEVRCSSKIWREKYRRHVISIKSAKAITNGFLMENTKT